MSESPVLQAPLPVLNQSGRISYSFDVIDAPSISFSDALHALSQECSSTLLPPPHWGQKSLTGFLVPHILP
jgi:hypothetical protein